MQSGQLKRRYPGAKPFSAQEKELFFGREEDTERLCRLVRREKLVVLYAKSGIGKSSLLNAGVVPWFHTKESGYFPVNVRFYSYSSTSQNGKARENEKSSLLKLLLDHLAAAYGLPGCPDTFLDLIYLEDEPSLWHFCKSLQLAQPHSPAPLLVFDQFEELFSYPEKQIRSFKNQLAELLYSDIPQRWRDAFNRFREENPKALREEEWKKFFEPIDVKTVIAIREDRLYLLDKLADQLPGILHKREILQPLHRQQARQAILQPAEKAGDFDSPPFTYESGALEMILDYLGGSESGQEAEIESFQIQLICQHIEENIVLKNQDTFIEKADIGDEQGLKDIAKNYYIHQIGKLPDEKSRYRARVFIEEDLVNEGDKSRITVPESYARSRLDENSLALLVNSHLLRAESNVRGNRNYELSHDTLVPPVLEFKAERKAEEARLEEERLAEEKRREELKLLEQKKAEEARKRKRFYLNASLIAFVLLLIGIIAGVLTYQARQAQKKAEKASKEASLEKQKAEAALNKLQLREKELEKVQSELRKKQQDLRQSDSIASSKSKEAAENLQKAEVFLQDISRREIKFAVEELNRLRDSVQIQAAYKSLQAAQESKDPGIRQRVAEALTEIAFVELYMYPKENWHKLKSFRCFHYRNGRLEADFDQTGTVFAETLQRAQALPGKNQARWLVLKAMEERLGKALMDKIKKKYL